MKTNDLIADLSLNLKPVRPPQNIFLFASKWTLFGFLVVALVILFVSPRPDIFQSLRSLETSLQIVSYGGLLFSALLLGAWWSVPGRNRGSAIVYAVIAAIFSLGFLSISQGWGLSDHDVEQGLSASGSACTLVSVVVGFTLGLFLTVKARQGAPSNPVKAGLVTGLAALGAGGLAITLHCDIDQGMHILAWHFGLPLLLMGGAGLIVGRIFLRW